MKIGTEFKFIEWLGPRAGLAHRLAWPDT